MLWKIHKNSDKLYLNQPILYEYLKEKKTKGKNSQNPAKSHKITYSQRQAYITVSNSFFKIKNEKICGINTEKSKIIHISRLTIHEKKKRNRNPNLELC